MKKATRQQTKQHNYRLVLKTVYDHTDLSRADVARITRLTRTTVSDIVSGLIEQDLLEERGLGESAGGKPPILLSVKNDARQVVCLDLSNHFFRGALVNLRGEISSQISLPVESPMGERALACVYELIDRLTLAATAPIAGIGIGSPGLVDAHGGVIRRAVNLGWIDLPLKSLLEGRYRLPIYIANDSQTAALAEFTFGAGKEASNLVVIKVGQGIGSGIVLQGQLHYGDGFGAGEIGHLKVVEDGAQCSCGNTGCLETVASQRAILQRACEARDGAISPSFPEVVQAYRAGDARIRELVCQAGQALGISIANLVGILNIHHIVISGGLQAFGEPLLEAARNELPSRVLSTMAAETKISYSTLGEDNVILGASALVLSREFGLV